MQKILQYILPFEPASGFSNHTFGELYAKWDQPSRQIQISAITFLTAMLYIVFAFLDKPWATAQAQFLMLKLHMFVVVPALLAISYFAYKQHYYKYVMPALAVFPIVSISCHTIIASKLEDCTPFAPEAYLGVFWVFIVSGMTFRYALFSASSSICILLVSAFHYIEQRDTYVMYVFWLSCSFSFGFLGALIFDRSRKQIFMNQQELQRLAVTDPLTGLYNRNQLNIILAKEMEREQRYESSFGFLLVDVDYFKCINDSFGHDKGDEVLIHIAQALQASVRKNDTLIRWGGEEFIVIAIEVNEHSLTALGEKLREKIEKSEYGEIGSVTVSIGTTLCKAGDTPSTLLARADKALYKAKEGGRNSTVYF